jgi:hypothetical protein
MTPIRDLITKIHHFGTNILGLLFMGSGVALICLAVFNAEFLPKTVAMAILTCSICVPLSCDFVWRYYSEPRYSAQRLLLPGSGGALLFVPVWLFFLAMLIMIGSIVVKALLKLI